MPNAALRSDAAAPRRLPQSEATRPAIRLSTFAADHGERGDLQTVQREGFSTLSGVRFGSKTSHQSVHECLIFSSKRPRVPDPLLKQP